MFEITKKINCLSDDYDDISEIKVDDLKSNTKLKKNEKNTSKSPTKSAKSHFTDATVTSENTNRIQIMRQPKISDKQINTYDIYQGMAYDDWAKTRDQFLSRHNMTTKIE